MLPPSWGSGPDQNITVVPGGGDPRLALKTGPAAMGAETGQEGARTLWREVLRMISLVRLYLPPLSHNSDSHRTAAVQSRRGCWD